MADTSLYTKFKGIKNDLKNIQKQIAKEYSEQAEKDLIKSFDSIIDDFYAQYTPRSNYNRKHNLYNALNKHRSNNKGGIGHASIDVNYYDMMDTYRTSKEHVFDLMWNSGVRGLPIKGSEPLKHSFEWLGHSFQEGEVWVNPFWSYNKDPYHNLFKVEASVRNYTTPDAIPRFAMKEAVENWDSTFNSSLNKTMKNNIVNNIKWCDANWYK